MIDYSKKEITPDGEKEVKLKIDKGFIDLIRVIAIVIGVVLIFIAALHYNDSSLIILLGELLKSLKP